MSTQTSPSNEPEKLENALELKEVEGLSQGTIVRRRFFRHKGAMIGLGMFIFVVLLAFTSVGVGGIHGWWNTPSHPERSGGSAPLVNAGGEPTMSLPSWLGGDGFAIGSHPFGQDEIGKDIFARVMEGTQTSLMVMFVVGIISCIIGVLVGSLSGYYRGRLDGLLMRGTDLVITIPTIVIGAVIGELTGSISPMVFAVALGLILWPSLARLVRGEFLSLREREFVDAARVAGASSPRIIFKHILPNAVGVIIVSTTLLMSSAILLETALSYLGFGITPPDVSLGKIISDNQSAFATRPWLFWWPGLFIVVIALSINFVGDGLRDAFDPRQKRIPSERKMRRAAIAERGGDAVGVAVATAAETGTTGTGQDGSGPQDGAGSGGSTSPDSGR